MSWDVLVLNYHGSPPRDDDEMVETEADPLGDASEVRAAISRHLEGVDWSDPGLGIYSAGELWIEFRLGESDLVDAMMLHVRGGGDAIRAMLQFAQPNGWSLFDCSTSEFLDPENPSQESWEEFQAYRDQAVTDWTSSKKNTTAKKKTPKKKTSRKKASKKRKT